MFIVKTLSEVFGYPFIGLVVVAVFGVLFNVCGVSIQNASVISTLVGVVICPVAHVKGNRTEIFVITLVATFFLIMLFAFFVLELFPDVGKNAVFGMIAVTSLPMFILLAFVGFSSKIVAVHDENTVQGLMLLWAMLLPFGAWTGTYLLATHEYGLLGLVLAIFGFQFFMGFLFLPNAAKLRARRNLRRLLGTTGG